MKIGILTFHRALNYGAFLQAYALKSYLETIDHQVEIIDYWPIEHEKLYEIDKLKIPENSSLKKKFILLMHFLFRRSRAKIKMKKMYQVQETHLKLSKKVKFRFADELAEVDYDAIIYGSDQIWWKSEIPGYLGYDFVYWGDFVPETTKKIAYAASMGIINATKEDQEILNQKLKNFSIIGTRENQLSAFVKGLGYPNVFSTIDPVFLLNKDFWLQQCQKISVPPKYLLLFDLTQTGETTSIANQIAKKQGLQIVEISPRIRPLKFGKNIHQTLNPFEFLYLIEKADYIVTSSFHCTAFSILFQKQFTSAGMGKNSNRVASLLDKIGIHGHLAIETQADSNEFIDYQYVTPMLTKEIEKSKIFLKESI